MSIKEVRLIQNSTLVFLVLVFINCSCMSEKRQGERSTYTEEWYYPNGTLKQSMEYDTMDSIENGIYLFYYDNGVLKDSAQMKMGKLHGKRYTFDEHGNLHKIITYNNHRYRNDEIYRPNGTLKLYRSFDYFKELRFFIEYDESGRIQDYEGEPIYNIVLEDQYSPGESFEVEFLVAKPPHCEVTFVSGTWNYDTGDLEERQELIPEENNSLRIELSHDAQKDQIIFNSVLIEEVHSGVTITDTLIFGIYADGSAKTIDDAVVSKQEE